MDSTIVRDPFGFVLTPEEVAEYEAYLDSLDKGYDSPERAAHDDEESRMLEELRERGVCPF